MRFCIEGVQQSIVRKRMSWACIVHAVIALSCARLETEPARDYFVMCFVLMFGSCFDARIAGKEQDYKRRSPTVGLHLFAGCFGAHFVGSNLASALAPIAPVT